MEISTSTKPPCSDPNCEKPAKSRGMCGNHYEVWRRAHPEEISVPAANRNPDGTRRTCNIGGCPSPAESLGLCRYHYHHFRYMDGKGRDKTRRNRKLTDQFGVKTEMWCTFPGCDKPEFNPGLCAGHYYQKKRGEELRPLREKAPCPVPGCEGEYSVKLSRSGVCRRCSGTCKRFSLTPNRLIELFTDAKCANPGCGATDNLHIDHDHSCCPQKGSCGKCVRGLLCRDCNVSLGSLHEDPRRIRGLVDYLEGFTK